MNTVFILNRSKRNANSAMLFCTGRDIENREIKMRTEQWEALYQDMVPSFRQKSDGSDV